MKDDAVFKPTDMQCYSFSYRILFSYEKKKHQNMRPFGGGVKNWNWKLKNWTEKSIYRLYVDAHFKAELFAEVRNTSPSLCMPYTFDTPFQTDQFTGVLRS